MEGFVQADTQPAVHVEVGETRHMGPDRCQSGLWLQAKISGLETATGWYQYPGSVAPAPDARCRLTPDANPET